MYHFMDEPARSVTGRVGTHDLGAAESLPLGTAPAGLIQLVDGAAVLPPDGPVTTRPREAGAP
jgi:hypothetical protein